MPHATTSASAATTELRRRPEQSRSTATFETLLEVAGRLLETHGFGSFTTNLLAAESGVSIRAIYRYFPNKHAIVAELAERLSSEWATAVDRVGDLGEPTVAWEPIWRGYLDTWVEAVVAAPGGRSVISAMRDVPELRAIDDQVNERYVAGIASALQRRRPALTADTAAVTARVLMRSTVGVLDEAVGAPQRERRRMIDELQSMHIQYLAHVLGEEPRHADR